MVDQSIIQKIKAATVAIGIRNNDEHMPIKIIGSGCIINTKGYLLTAAHVAKACHDEMKNEVNKGNRKVRFAMYRSGQSNYEITDIEQFSFFEWDPKASEDSKKLELDVACSKPLASLTGFPFLEIEDFVQFRTLDDILMGGYPGGEYTFSIEPSHGLGSRFNPLLQQGRISGLMPIDDTSLPDGFITDIIGTSGSSGSPITDMEARIVGVACWVIPSPLVQSEKVLPKAYSPVGLVYALGNNKFLHWVQAVVKYYDTGDMNPPKVASAVLKF
ncbi:MAG: serine protease [Nitrososphaera sp.]